MFSIWVVKLALVAGFITLQSKVRHKTEDKGVMLLCLSHTCIKWQLMLLSLGKWC